MSALSGLQTTRDRIIRKQRRNRSRNTPFHANKHPQLAAVTHRQEESGKPGAADAVCAVRPSSSAGTQQSHQRHQGADRDVLFVIHQMFL
jgi:hypothetical protein